MTALICNLAVATGVATAQDRSPSTGRDVVIEVSEGMRGYERGRENIESVRKILTDQGCIPVVRDGSFENGLRVEASGESGSFPNADLATVWALDRCVVRGPNDPQGHHVIFRRGEGSSEVGLLSIGRVVTERGCPAIVVDNYVVPNRFAVTVNGSIDMFEFADAAAVWALRMCSRD